jgi:Cu(I)/Ag(I) efflux system membrane fusion protein
MTFRNALAVLALALPILVGCGGDASDEHDHDHDHAGHDRDKPAAGADDAAKIAEAMAELSPEDRAAAMKQKTCPVSDEPLGAMGKPMKVELEGGKSLFICCGGCRKKVMSDPAKYLAKVGQ